MRGGLWRGIEVQRGSQWEKQQKQRGWAELEILGSRRKPGQQKQSPVWWSVGGLGLLLE
jgi:hypothetical protein